MKRITLIAVVVALTLTGCEEKTPDQKRADQEARQAANQKSLANPELIGQLPDGRPLYAAFVKKEDAGFTHTVYWAGADVTEVAGSKEHTTTAHIGPKEGK